MEESLEIRLARIEERLMAFDAKTHSKLDSILNSVNGLGKIVRSHAAEIARVKHDRKWIIGMFTLLFSGLSAWIAKK